ncbi:MAG: alpha-amylase family glycosyl hydrolase [Prevotella sp.]|nr:alpha-amylase family glycosyl hydrolase [Prevotella sp.]
MMKRLVFIFLVLCGILPSMADDFSDTFVGGRTDFRDESIYFVITTRFYDGDPSNNWQCWDNQEANEGDPAWRGDFKGLIDKLDYIKALGFTAVWITPVVQNASGYDYHGYHAMDMSRVDDRLLSHPGEENDISGDVDFQTLIDEAHARGMKIILDIVLNHTGNFGENRLCQLFRRDIEANQATIDKCMIPVTTGMEDDWGNAGKLPTDYLQLSGSEQYQARLHEMKNNDGVNHDSHNYWHHKADFNWDDDTRWWGQIAGDCVDLNTENPVVYKYVRECYGNFIKMGVDGFRIDTSSHIARSTFNKVFIPYFLALGDEYRHKRLNACPFFIFGEVCARFQGSVTYRGLPPLSPYFYTWQSDESLLAKWNDDPSYWDTVVIGAQTSASEIDNQKLAEEEYAANKSETSQPKSSNTWLNGNDYHTPDHSLSSGFNVIDFPVHYSFNSVGSVWGLFDSDDFYNDATYNVVYVDSHDYSPGPNDGIRFNGGTDQWAENLDLMFTFRGIPCLFYGSEVEFRKGVKIDNGANGLQKDTGRAYFGGYIKGSVTPVGFGQYTDATGNIEATLSRPLARHIGRLSQIRQQIPALRKGQYSKQGCSSQGGYAFKRRYVAEGIDSYALVTISAGATFTGVLNGRYLDVVSGDVKEVTDGRLVTRPFSGKGQMAVYVLNGTGQIGTDGPYLFDTTPAPLPTLAYDGTQEEKSSNNGSAEGTTPPVGIDDLEVYVPSISSVDERSIFYEASAECTGVRIWVWNSSFGFTGSSWDARPSMKLMGKTTDGTRKIFKWTYEGGEASMPTGLIFHEYGGSQTADLVYVNNGYYIGSSYDHTVDNVSSISDVRIDAKLPSAYYTIGGRKVTSYNSRGIYCGKGFKIIK